MSASETKLSLISNKDMGKVLDFIQKESPSTSTDSPEKSGDLGSLSESTGIFPSQISWFQLFAMSILTWGLQTMVLRVPPSLGSLLSLKLSLQCDLQLFLSSSCRR